MVQRYVYGTYPTGREAEQTATTLQSSGVPSDSILIVGNDRSVNDLESTTFRVVSTDNMETGRDTEEDRGFWESVKDAFTGEDTPVTNDTTRTTDTGDVDLDRYRSSLNEGEVLVLVDVEHRDQLNNREVSHGDPTMAEDSERVKLHEERLTTDTYEDPEASKDVKFTKRVVEDEETKEVPVRREELEVTHRDVTDERDVDTERAFQEEEIDVHVSKEKPRAERETIVTDEVEIEKEVETDVEEVKGKTRKEVLDVDDDSVDGLDTDNRNRRRDSENRDLENRDRRRETPLSGEEILDETDDDDLMP